MTRLMIPFLSVFSASAGLCLLSPATVSAAACQVSPPPFRMVHGMNVRNHMSATDEELERYY